MAQPRPHLPLDVHALEARLTFRCFNTDVQVQAADWRWSHLLPAVEAFFHRFEARFSRFRPDSELSRFNRRDVDSVQVSEAMLDILAECVRLYALTRGVFNPLILERLESAGYDASFERLGEGAPAGMVEAAPAPDLGALVLDWGRREARLPAGLRLDLGGIGKGFAVDVAASMLAQAGDFLVDAGGDIYAGGSAPGGGPWRIEVADPLAPDGCIEVVELSDAAIASSWTTRRRWPTRHGFAHHLIDPRTGLPAGSGVAGATVLAPLATDADVFAKCAVILGADEGAVFLESVGACGLFVLDDGRIRKTRNWPSI